MRSTLDTGMVIGRFRIEGVLGEGAMGIVYLATDSTTGAAIALKALVPELASDERFRQRFLKESALARTLDHPHIVPTVAAGEHDRFLYLAMAHIDDPYIPEFQRPVEDLHMILDHLMTAYLKHLAAR